MGWRIIEMRHGENHTLRIMQNPGMIHRGKHRRDCKRVASGFATDISVGKRNVRIFMEWGKGKERWMKVTIELNCRWRERKREYSTWLMVIRAAIRMNVTFVVKSFPSVLRWAHPSLFSFSSFHKDSHVPLSNGNIRSESTCNSLAISSVFAAMNHAGILHNA